MQRVSSLGLLALMNFSVLLARPETSARFLSSISPARKGRALRDAGRGGFCGPNHRPGNSRWTVGPGTALVPRLPAWICDKSQRSWGHQKDSALKNAAEPWQAPRGFQDQDGWWARQAARNCSGPRTGLASTRRAFSPPKRVSTLLSKIILAKQGKRPSTRSSILLLGGMRVRKPANFRHNGGRSVRCFHLVLGVVTHAQLGSRCDISAAAVQTPGKNFEQGGFSRTVMAYKAQSGCRCIP